MCRFDSDCFTAFRFMSTSSLPFDENFFTMSFSSSFGALPSGRIGHRLKNTDCMIMLMRCFRPTDCATAVASML